MYLQINFNTSDERFPKCGPRIARDLLPVPKLSLDTFLLWLLWNLLNFLIKRTMFLKNSWVNYLIGCFFYFVWPLEYLITKSPVPTMRATVRLLKVKSCSALLRMLSVCTNIYLNLVLLYKFLILNTCLPVTLYSREQTCKDPPLFFEAERGPRTKTFGKPCFK
jgi:hypothetical protein